MRVFFRVLLCLHGSPDSRLVFSEGDSRAMPPASNPCSTGKDSSGSSDNSSAEAAMLGWYRHNRTVPCPGCGHGLQHTGQGCDMLT